MTSGRGLNMLMVLTAEENKFIQKVEFCVWHLTETDGGALVLDFWRAWGNSSFIALYSKVYFDPEWM